MGGFSAAGGRQLGLGAEGPASLQFVVGCTNMSRFKLLELSGENGRTQIGCSISKLKSTQCNFRCELCDVPRIAELLLEELSVEIIVSPSLGHVSDPSEEKWEELPLVLELSAQIPHLQSCTYRIVSVGKDL